MLNFTFYNPTKIISGSGRIKDIDKEISKESKDYDYLWRRQR